MQTNWAQAENPQQTAWLEVLSSLAKTQKNWDLERGCRSCGEARFGPQVMAHGVYYVGPGGFSKVRGLESIFWESQE